tara:strand:+ start:752 stop:958 length:207 start_codon:yes stop_codon:yes gene_type:complete
LTHDEILEKGNKIMSKRRIDERQARGESVSVDEIFNEADEIGKMLEDSMGSERFNRALKALEDKESNQ